jgi:hypothetical protein
MSQIKSINKDSIEWLRNALEQHMRASCKSAGVALSTGSARYSDTYVTIQVTFSLVNKSREVQTPEKSDLEKYGQMFGLKGKYGEEFTSRGTRYRIVGLLPKRLKYSVVGQDSVSGKRLLFTVEGVNRALAVSA